MLSILSIAFFPGDWLFSTTLERRYSSGFSRTSKTYLATAVRRITNLGIYDHKPNVKRDHLLVKKKLQKYNMVSDPPLHFRSNIFGFPNAAGLAEESLGLLDQYLSLEWVQKNIGAFCGDTSRMVVWGHSAGVSPLAGSVLHSR
jgi:hypothetical protein